MRTSDYKELKVWRAAMDVVVDVYRLCKRLPPEEKFGLTDQIRRAAVSIPSNIAEGQARNTPRDFIHFINIARGSACEVETQLLLCIRLNFLSSAHVEPILNSLNEINYMLISLAKYLQELHKTQNKKT